MELRRTGTLRAALLVVIAAFKAGEVAAAEKPFQAGAFALEINPRKFPVIVNAMFTERSADRVQDSIGGVIEDICHDINISIDYFENQYDKKVEEVYITGGASSTIGLPETLERTVQKPVNRWNPLQYFDLELSRESQQELQDNPTQAAIALGLASRIVE